MKKEVATLDLTPVWQGVLPGLLAILMENNNANVKNEAKIELNRMAMAADNWNDHIKNIIDPQHKKTYDWKTHGDFKMYWDKKLKRHYWTLGYFGGGAINIATAFRLAVEFHKIHNVPIDTVVIDEIQSSRRHKHFKVIWSDAEQKQHKDSDESDNVWGWLTD